MCLIRGVVTLDKYSSEVRKNIAKWDEVLLRVGVQEGSLRLRGDYEGMCEVL